MSVKYILAQAGNKMGLDPDNEQERPTLVRFLNEAARELYKQSDMPGSLMEQVFKVNGDQTISLPSYVGAVRAVREAASMQVWHLNQMRPRYNQFNWPDMWRNIRLKYKSPLQNSMKNESFVVVTVPEVEDPPIVVSITGRTNQSSLISEEIVMDEQTKQGQYCYISPDGIFSVKKDRTCDFDVTVSDVAGNILTVIPNQEFESKYQILDVSSCPWLPQNTSPLDNYLEVLYKRSLPYLFNDDDEFPAFDYDDIVVNKIMQLWAEEQEKPEIAERYDAKATRTSAWTTEDQNRATEDMVALVANPHDTMLKRIGTGLRRRYALYAGRRY